METTKVVVRAKDFNIHENGVGPMEAALEMDGDLPVPLILVQDLVKGGHQLYTDSQWFAEFLQLLLLIEPQVLPLLKSDWPDQLRQLDAEGIVEWAGKQTWIVDPNGFVPLDRLNSCVFISTEPPQNPNVWGKVIEVRQGDGTVCHLFVDGEERSSIPMADARFYPNLGKSVNALMTEEKKKRTPPEVLHPTLKHDGARLFTTLQAEVDYLLSLIRNRMFNFIPPQGSKPDQILDILLSHTESSVVVSKTVRQQLRNIIAADVRAKKPVLVTLSMAIACIIPNPLKFHDMVQLPTFGWLYLAWFFRFINEKVQKVYEPGLRVVFFDEATLFADLMEIDPKDVVRHLEATRAIIKALGAPIEIVTMKPDMFDYDLARKISVEVPEEKIYAIACSMQGMNIAEAMDPLYAVRDKDWSALRAIIGEEIWQEAARRVKEITQVLAWRKRADLFGKLLGGSGIDACITDKDGRVVFDVTSPALINHGQIVVERRGERLVARVVPEYRITREYPKARPVFLRTSELGVDHPEVEEFILYYHVQ